MLFKIRKAKVEDLNFILHSMLKNMKNGSQFARNILSEDFYSAHREVIAEILSRSETLIAHLPDDEDVILGYFIFEEGNIGHFCFVKKAFRGYGIAKALFHESKVDPLELTITHWTNVMNDLIYKFDNVRYNPYLALRGGHVRSKTKHENN